MEGPKELAPYSSSSSSSSTSISAELSGLKPKTASPGRENVFSSIFPLPSKPGEFPKFRVHVNEQYASEYNWNVKPDNSEGNRKSDESERRSIRQKEASYIYHHQKLQPMHLSSSIYYGGQEVFPGPNDNHDAASKSNLLVNNNNGEDDSGSASRGDWWQGSLYY